MTLAASLTPTAAVVVVAASVAFLVVGQVLMPEGLLGDGQLGLHGRKGQRFSVAIDAFPGISGFRGSQKSCERFTGRHLGRWHVW